MVHFIHGRALLYTNNNANFYARESSTSKWVKLIAFDADGNSASNNHPDVTRRIITDWSVTPNEKKLTNYYTIPTKYVEFGFEFYLKEGTNYPYSDVFWTAEDSAKTPANNILIDTLGGGLYTPRLTIKVNDQEVFHDSNCSAHIPHYFKMDDDTHVKTWKTGTYLNKAMNFYARKSENGLWTQVKSWTDGDQDFTIPETEGYVEYGFEFDQKDGTDWPYSGVFWTASDSEREKAGLIYIEMGGTIRFASINIGVNGKKVVSESNCSSHIQHYWNTADKIRVNTYKTGSYSLNVQRVYARKSSTRKWDIVLTRRTATMRLRSILIMWILGLSSTLRGALIGRTAGSSGILRRMG